MLDVIRERRVTRGYLTKSTCDQRELKQDTGGLPAGRLTAHNMQNFELIVVDDKKLMERIAAIPFPMTKGLFEGHTEQLSTTEENGGRKRRRIGHELSAGPAGKGIWTTRPFNR